MKNIVQRTMGWRVKHVFVRFSIAQCVGFEMRECFIVIVEVKGQQSGTLYRCGVCHFRCYQICLQAQQMCPLRKHQYYGF